MIKHEVGDTVTKLILHNSHDTDFYCIKPDGTEYILQQRQNLPKKIIQISQA